MADGAHWSGTGKFARSEQSPGLGEALGIEESEDEANIPQDLSRRCLSNYINDVRPSLRKSQSAGAYAERMNQRRQAFDLEFDSKGSPRRVVEDVKPAHSAFLPTSLNPEMRLFGCDSVLQKTCSNRKRGSFKVFCLLLTHCSIPGRTIWKGMQGGYLILFIISKNKWRKHAFGSRKSTPQLDNLPSAPSLAITMGSPSIEGVPSSSSDGICQGRRS